MKEKMKIRIRIDQDTLLPRQSFLEICYASTWLHFGSSVSTGIWRWFLPEGKKSTARMKRTGLLLCVRCTMKLLFEQPTLDLNCSDTSGQTALHEAAFFFLTILGLWICSWLTRVWQLTITKTIMTGHQWWVQYFGEKKLTLFENLSPIQVSILDWTCVDLNDLRFGRNLNEFAR